MVGMSGAISLVAAFPGGAAQMASFTPLYAIVTAVSEVAMVGIPVLILYYGMPIGKTIAFPKAKWKWHTLLVIPIALLTFYASNGLSTLWMGILRLMGSGTGESMNVAMPASWMQTLVSVGVVGLIPAVVEELFFRGFMLPSIKNDRNPWPAIVLTAMLFALMHGNTMGVHTHFLVGITIGIVVYATGSIWAGVLHHFLHNSLAMVISYAQTLAEAESEALLYSLPEAWQWILEGGMYTVLAGIPAALLIWLLWKANRKGMEQREKETEMNPALCNQVVSAKAYWPLLVAMPFVFANYLTTAVMMFIMP